MEISGFLEYRGRAHVTRTRILGQTPAPNTALASAAIQNAQNTV